MTTLGMTASVQLVASLDRPLSAGADEDPVHAPCEALSNAARHGQAARG
jgi:signal transduction histidine kinase